MQKECGRVFCTRGTTSVHTRYATQCTSAEIAYPLDVCQPTLKRLILYTHNNPLPHLYCVSHFVQDRNAKNDEEGGISATNTDGEATSEKIYVGSYTVLVREVAHGPPT